MLHYPRVDEGVAVEKPHQVLVEPPDDGAAQQHDGLVTQEWGHISLVKQICHIVTGVNIQAPPDILTLDMYVSICKRKYRN